LTVNELVNECPVCRRRRESESEFCSLHSRAMKNIIEAREKWCLAFGQELARPEYFERLLRLEATGTAVKDVIIYLQRKPDGGE